MLVKNENRQKEKAMTFLKNMRELKQDRKNIWLQHHDFESAKLMNKIIRKTNNLKRKKLKKIFKVKQ